ncbi:MAG: hypothetical protein JW915_13480 [Chitinispirillaceae bacterium]|nr:hypothetical protein [Chitinispirillaceae bacterium]
MQKPAKRFQVCIAQGLLEESRYRLILAGNQVYAKCTVMFIMAVSKLLELILSNSDF